MSRACRRGAFGTVGAVALLWLGGCAAPNPPPAAMPIAPVNVLTAGVLSDVSIRSERPVHRWSRWGLEARGVAPWAEPRMPRSPAFPARNPLWVSPWPPR